MSKTFDFSDYEKPETETKTSYNPFTTTSTTTQQPTIEREKDVVSKDSELSKIQKTVHIHPHRKEGLAYYI